MEDEKPRLAAPIQTWRLEDAPRPYQRQLEEITDPEERAEYKWVTWLPSREHMRVWWGDPTAGASPGSMGQNYRAGVLFYIVQYMDGFLTFTTNNDEGREAAAGG